MPSWQHRKSLQKRIFTANSTERFSKHGGINDEGKPVDTVTLQDRLREKDVPPEVSSLEFIRELLNTLPTSAHIKNYANIVAEKAMLRRLIKV